MSYFEWNIIHISKFKPGTVEKNSSTIGPPAGTTTLIYTLITPALVSYLRSSVARALHRHRKGVGSIPAGGPIVDEFFSNVPGLNLDMCIIFHSK